MTRLVALVAAVTLLSACATFGDGPTEVSVNGETYTLIALAEDDLSVAQADLTAVGPVAAPRGIESDFAELTAYALDGVDPRGFLLIPKASSEGEDEEARDGYWGLMGPGDVLPAVCVYFEPGRFDGC